MDSSEVPAPLQQSSDNLVCDVCDVKCGTLAKLNSHYGDIKHKSRSKDLSTFLFGYLPDRRTTCLDDVFNRKKIGPFIGMHYVKEICSKPGNLYFSCILCNVECQTMFQHIVSFRHKRKYIEKAFSFIFSDGEFISPKVIERIATVIEEVEGLQKFKVAMKNHTESSSASDCSSSQTVHKIVKQLQIHGIVFKYPYLKKKDESCLATEAPCFRRIRRGFKRGKLEQPTQSAREPIKKSRPVPVPFSDPAVGVSAGKNLKNRNSRQPTKRSSTSDIPPIKDMESKPIPSLVGTHSGSGAYQTTCPLAGEYFPSRPPAQWLNQTAEHRHGYYSNRSLCGFTNNSAHGQASSVSDVGKAYALEAPTWGQETGPPGAQHLYTLGTMGRSSSSLTGPTSSVPSLKHTTSRYGYSSFDIKELSSKPSSSLGIISVLNKEPSFPKSHQDSSPSEGLPPGTIGTSSRVQTSLSTNSDMPVKAASMLSPHTLKVLQGRDAESVKSILKRLSEYCPELQEVNISLLVDVLFETGALR